MKHHFRSTNTYEDAEEETIKAFEEKGQMSFCFSATPKPLLIDAHHNKFDYTLAEGIRDKFLVPLILDNSLPQEEMSSEQIITMLKKQCHPCDGRALVEHKGIIYVKGRAAAILLAQELNNAIFGLNVFEIHSHNSNSKTDLEAFKKARTGIAIAVEMLVEGFDDSSVDWAMVNKRVKEDTAIQMIGRVLRPDVKNKQKIALVLLNPHIVIEAFQGSKLFPTDRTEPSYQSVSETLRLEHNSSTTMNIHRVCSNASNQLSSHVEWQRRGIKSIKGITLFAVDGFAEYGSLSNLDTVNVERIKTQLSCGN